MIYLDNAATIYHKPDAVVNAVADAMRHMGNAGRGAHEASLDTSRIMYETREQLAELFGLWKPGRESCGRPSGVALAASSTESLNIAIQGLFQPGDHVITTVMEHNSVLYPLYLVREWGLELSIAPAGKKGNIRYEDLEHLIRPDTKAIVYAHTSNLTGNMIDVERVGGTYRKRHFLLIMDASQSAGVFDIDMEKTGTDALYFTGYKSLMSPQGVGGIYVRGGIRIRPLVVGESGVHSYSKTHPDTMPTALEAGTFNGHGVVGLHTALAYLGKLGSGVIREKEQQLMSLFYHGMKDIPGVIVYGDFDVPLRASIVTLNTDNYDSGEVSDALAVDYGILTRAGAHCAPLMHEALGTKEQGAVRFSLSFHNTEEEVRTAVKAVEELAQ